MDLGDEGLLSPEAVASPPVYGRAHFVARFEDGPVRQLVHRLKYGDRMELAKPLGSMDGARRRRASRRRRSPHAYSATSTPALCNARFNQANALAQAVSAASGVALDPFILARVKPTQSQVGLSRSQRALNLQGAFRVPEEMAAQVEGRAIVIIDDVMTSGATVNAAARALLRAKARRVDVLVFARVV